MAGQPPQPDDAWRTIPKSDENLERKQDRAREAPAGDPCQDGRVLVGVLGLAMFMAFVPQFTITTQFFQQKSLGLAIEVQTVRANVGATVSPDVFGGLRDVASGSEAAWKLCGLLCAAAALVAVVLWQAESKQRRSYLRLPAPGNPDFESP